MEACTCRSKKGGKGFISYFPPSDVKGVLQQHLLLQKPPWDGHPLLITRSFTPQTHSAGCVGALNKHPSQPYTCSPSALMLSNRHLEIPGEQPALPQEKSPGRISYPLALKHHHSNFSISHHDEEKKTLPSGHHHPHPRGCQMKIQAINTGEAQIIYLQIY